MLTRARHLQGAPRPGCPLPVLSPSLSSGPRELSRSFRPLAVCDQGDYILIVKKNQPSLYTQVKNLPWRHIPAGDRHHTRGHGRDEFRTIRTAAVVAGLTFPQ